MAYEFRGKITVDAIITIDGEKDYDKALRMAKNFNLPHVTGDKHVNIEVEHFKSGAEIKRPGITV